MTAADLLASLTAAGVTPTVEGGDLILPSDPPPQLADALSVLHPGVTALIAGSSWWGCDGRTGRSFVLDPGQPIPANVTLLGVGGEPGWDRIHPVARQELPHLFAPPPGGKKG